MVGYQSGSRSLLGPNYKDVGSHRERDSDKTTKSQGSSNAMREDCPSMSRGPSAQVTFIQGNQSTREHDASHSTQHSALFYLFQEVSKLASPIHNSFVDSNPPSTWVNEHTGQGPFIGKKEEEDAYSYEVSNSSCQHSLPHISPYNQGKKVKDKSSKVATLVETYPECNSPWRVLSLINLQCEKLLQHSAIEGLNTSSVSSATKVGHSIDSTAAARVTDQQVGVDCISVECSFRPSICIFDREEIPAHVSHQEDTRVCSGEASGYKPGCCAKDPNVDICVDSHPSKPAQVKENATEPTQPHPTDKVEDKFSVNRQFEWNPDCKKDCASSEQDVLNVPLYENVSSNTTHIPDPDVEANAPPSKPSLTYDCNANLALIAAPPCVAQLNPLSSILPSLPSSSLLFNIKEKCHSLPKQGDKSRVSQLDCTYVPVEEKSPPAAQLKSSGCNGETNSASSAASKPKPRPMQEEDIDPPTTQNWRTKTPRKQPHPSRSVDIQDPDFQGVTFRMDTELDDSREQCRLLITSKYSKELCKSIRKPRPRTRTSQKSLETSSSDEDGDPTTRVSKLKVCASCCTRKTPMWRDADDGTPLCNACGIRYKKYRVRCINCWHIPRKEGNSNSRCLKCGNFARLTSAQRKHST